MAIHLRPQTPLYVRIGDAGRSAAQPLIAENLSGTTGLSSPLSSPPLSTARSGSASF
jgi:hypothetical protein